MNRYQTRRIVFVLCVTALIGAATEAFAQESTPDPTDILTRSLTCTNYLFTEDRTRAAIEESLAQVSEEIETQGETLERLDCRARFNLFLGNFSQAARDYARLTSLDDGNVDNASSYVFLSAYAWMLDGNYFFARAAAHQLATEYGDMRLHFVALGNIAVAQRRYSDALDFFNAAYEQGSNDAGFYLARGIAYTGLGRSEDARRDIEQALELDPELLTHALEWAEFAFYLENNALAASLFQRVIVIDPNNAETQIKYAVSLFFSRDDNDAEILSALYRAYALDSTRVDTFQWLGFLLLRQRNCSAALEALEEFARQADSASVSAGTSRIIEYLQQAGDECSFRDLDNWLAANS